MSGSEVESLARGCGFCFCGSGAWLIGWACGCSCLCVYWTVLCGMFIDVVGLGWVDVHVHGRVEIYGSGIEENRKRRLR